MDTDTVQQYIAAELHDDGRNYKKRSFQVARRI